ncbi:MAG: hypothetical protein Q9187_004159, partial [Circinaria calcarea]
MSSPPRQRNHRVNAKISLPQCEGPKLHPFIDDRARLEFVQLLSDTILDANAYVTEFKYYNDKEDDLALDELERDLVSRPVAGNPAPLDHLDYYFDPFYNECRAYGKLVEAKLNGEVAVRCHGYLILSAKREDDLDHRFAITGWNRPIEEYDKLPSKRQPLRAIVKDLVLEDTKWSPLVANKMLRDLRKTRKHEVYAMDIKPENYKGGLLVDFSIALTDPHLVFKFKPDWQVEGYKNEDLIAFDPMIRDKKVKTTIRA